MSSPYRPPISVNSLNTGSVPNTRYKLLETMMSHIAAFGRIKHRWATLWPLAPLLTDGPLCGPSPISSKHPEFGEYYL